MGARVMPPCSSQRPTVNDFFVHLEGDDICNQVYHSSLRRAMEGLVGYGEGPPKGPDPASSWRLSPRTPTEALEGQRAV
jgi:hypothetical protein